MSIELPITTENNDHILTEGGTSFFTVDGKQVAVGIISDVITPDQGAAPFSQV